MLYGRAQPGEAGKPWLVFVHGFSGSGEEWRLVGEQLAPFPCLYLDLPGHGGSSAVAATSFTQVDAALSRSLISYNILNYWLVGYSLGGRVAMHFACQRPPGLQGLVVEGGHPGLTDDQARQARWQSDTRWAQRFRSQPLLEVFNDWYQQPVFASLSPARRRALARARSRNDGQALAAMLEATSLAIQPDLRGTLRELAAPFHYLSGEYDRKFRALAAETSAVPHLIVGAGHNAHREQPDAVARCLAQILRLI